MPDAAALPYLAPALREALRVLETDEAPLLAVLDLAPTHPEALRALHAKRAAQGRTAAVRAILERLASFHPNDWWARAELAVVLMGVDNARAIEQARSAVRLAPGHARTHDVLGMVMIEARQPHAGAWHCARAVELSGRRDPVLLANLAWGLKAQGRLAEARAAYREAAAIAPDSLQVNLGWAQAELADRDPDRAAELLDRAARVVPGHAGLLAARALLLEMRGQFAAALALLDGSPARNPELLLARGRMLDRLGRYSEAFAAFAAGKALWRATGEVSYPADQVAAMLARLEGFYTAPRLALLPRAGLRADVPQPVFIMGFPRSGTTLTEQALSSHPAIAAGDELPLLGETAEAVPRLLASPLFYPEALAELWMGDCLDGLDVLRDHYLRGAARLGAMQPDKPFFTDKMPLNETQIGLAALIFPQAPLIHVVRHPLDVVLSVFGTLLTHGFHCAAELQTTALHYVRIADFVRHMRREVNPRYLAIRYEDMVENLEGSLRRMLDLAGLPFDPACLAFHANQRHARTASQIQVAEPLYTRSANRWRNYRAELAPVIPILEPVIRELGYSLD